MRVEEGGLTALSGRPAFRSFVLASAREMGQGAARNMIVRVCEALWPRLITSVLDPSSGIWFRIHLKGGLF